MKRLVILCDGTWNRADQKRDGKPCPTNVVKLHRAVAERSPDGVEQRCHYHPGVGTRLFTRLRGGAFGMGLGKHVREVYTWLCENYDVGDELFFFGFSRGAFTARSAVGMIRTCGVVSRGPDGRVSRKDVDRAYDLYRQADGDPDHAAALEFRRARSVAQKVPVRCVGVWDTVGALGIPLTGARWVAFNKRYEFHNAKLSHWVEAAYHALAIDEHRGPFRPTVWENSEVRARTGQPLEQVWFPGAHSDVGGGYGDARLSELTLRWMVGRAESQGLAILEDFVPAPDDASHTVESRVHDSRTWIYRRIPAYQRALGATAPEHEFVSHTTHERVAGTHALKDPGDRYEPPGLLSYLATPQLADLDPPRPTAAADPPTTDRSVAKEPRPRGAAPSTG